MTDGLRVAADIGGTFTDIAFITRDGVVATRKVPSTPGNYADAVIRGIDELMAEQKLDKGQIAEVLHGCTVATNTIVEHKGAKTALITTRGFREAEMREVARDVTRVGWDIDAGALLGHGLILAPAQATRAIRRRRSELRTTETDESAIAPAASPGLSNSPKNG